MTIEATISPSGDRVFLRSDYDDRDAAKTVPGARWRPVERVWSYPLTVETCLDLRAAFDARLHVGADLAAWYREGARVRSAQTLRSTQADETLETLPQVALPLASTLRPDQRVTAAWVRHAYRDGGLLADAPGTGKTLATIAGLIERRVTGNVLVVCPRLSVKAVWLTEFRRWAPHLRVYVARGTRPHRERAIARYLLDPAETKVLVVIGEMLRVKRRKPTEDETKSSIHKRNRIEGYEYPSIGAITWNAVVVDESQRYFGSLTVAQANLAGEGVMKLSVAPGGLRLAISATPYGRGGRVQGMFGTLHWLWPDEFTSYWQWAERNFEVEDEYIPGGRGKMAKRIIGLKSGTTEQQFYGNLGPRILRRTKAEVLPDLPPKQYVEVLCEMEAKQRKQYLGLDADAEIVTDNGVITANGVLAVLTRARQIANGCIRASGGGKVTFAEESCKLDALKDILRKRGVYEEIGSDKYLIASQFNEFLAIVARHLDDKEVPYLTLTGATNDAKRDEAMAEFQSEGGPRIFLINSKAGGVSVTLDAASEVHVLDEMQNPEDNEQLEDRIHRASRNHQVTIFNYRTEGTIDVNTIKVTVEDKRQAQFRVLDGRRGLDYARNVIQYRKPEEDNE